MIFYSHFFYGNTVGMGMDTVYMGTGIAVWAWEGNGNSHFRQSDELKDRITEVN